MFSHGVAVLFCLILSAYGQTTDDVEVYRPCDSTDTYCIKEHLAAGFLGLVTPIHEQGSDSYHDKYPLVLTLPSFNASMFFSENLFAGFHTGVITDYYILVENNFTVVTAHFDYVTIESTYELTVTDLEVTGRYIVIPGTGNTTLTDVTIVMAFPGLDSLDEANVVTIMESEGFFDFSSINSYAEYDVLAQQFLDSIADNPEQFLDEFNDQIDDRIAHWYFLTNIGHFELDYRFSK